MADDWLRVDVCRDVLISTDLLALLTPRLRKHPTEWKWVVLAAQNAVQGAVISAIHDTTKTNVLSDGSAKKMLNWLDTLTGEPPYERLADFPTLIDKFREKHPVLLSEEVYDQVTKLHETFRNKFAHFVATSWSIELSMLPPLVRSAIDLVDAAMAQPQVLMRINGNFKRKLASNLNIARQALDSGLGADCK